MFDFIAHFIAHALGIPRALFAIIRRVLLQPDAQLTDPRDGACRKDESFTQARPIKVNLMLDASSPADADRIRALRSKAEMGDAHALNRLGMMLWSGDRVQQDYAEAAKLYRLAAEQGLPLAQHNLAWLYHSGEGVSKDIQMALRLYRRAADAGQVNSQCNLGCLLLNGIGVQQDEREAVRYYRLAAAQGHAGALYNLAQCYELGRGITSKNEWEAARLYREAADKGAVLAFHAAAEAYANGLGGEKDEQKAAHFLRLVSAHGNERNVLLHRAQAHI